MRILYALVGALAIAGFSFAAMTGWEMSTATRKFTPQSVRGKQPGGTRAVYYGGYRGGK